MLTLLIISVVNRNENNLPLTWAIINKKTKRIKIGS